MKSLLSPIQLIVLAFALLLLLAFGVLGRFIWYEHLRLGAFRDGIDHIRAVQALDLKLLELLSDDLTGTPSINRDEQLQRVGAEAALLAAQRNEVMVTDTADKLAQITLLLAGDSQVSTASLAAVMKLFRQATHQETSAVSQLLATTHRSIQTQIQLISAVLLLFSSLLAIVLWLLRKRIFGPLKNLSESLSLLADGKFTPLPLRNADPLLLPLLKNYNHAVTRLEELETEVHATARTLLQQQTLARTERLAVVGELSASLAHELRNPLAAIQLALINLRHDSQDPSHVERLDSILAVVERITCLLNDLLQKARHAPEPLRLINLAKLIEELLALVRYQAPVEIALDAHVPDDLKCCLPENQLRQTLFNLVSNAIQALQGRKGTITIKAEKIADVLQLSVCDDGPGFPEPLLANGIRAFVGGRNSGSGLGLAITQRFARNVGGKLELSNQKLGGACATLVLPCREGND